MPESFGDRLRQQRERQEVTLERIAEQSKIKLSLLEGLERGDVSHWPTGIFRRAFIRAYALAIGLEPDAVVREFLERYPDPAEVVAIDPSLRPDVDTVHEGVAPPTRFRYLVSSAISSLAGRRTAAPPDRSRAAQSYGVARHSSIEPTVVHDRSVASPHAIDESAAEAERTTSMPELSIVDVPLLTEPGAPDERTAIDDAAPASEGAAVAAACVPSPIEPDFEAAAHLCTDLGRAVHTQDVAPLLSRAAAVLDAVGLIVWAWDPRASALKAAVAHGYSDRVLAQLPAVKRDAANATAAAFRTAQPCSVAGDDHANGALVAPLIASEGCVGVLAIEWPLGREQSPAVRSVATIFAALLARWISAAAPADMADRRLA